MLNFGLRNDFSTDKTDDHSKREGLEILNIYFKKTFLFDVFS